MIADAVAVKERPILFSTEMVKAIMAGRKTQTRRVCKFRITGPNPPSDLFDMYDADEWIGAFPNGDKLSSAATNCPYGVPGNRLWVRETFLLRAAGKSVVYRAAVEGAHGAAEAAGFGAMYGGWKPSIFMPRWASRITLEITNIRIERVQQITEADARAEGCDFDDAEPPEGYSEKDRPTAYSEYRYLWDRINAKSGFGWDTNPFVWVIEFKSL